MRYKYPNVGSNRGCIFEERFTDALHVQHNGGTVVGTPPTIDNKLVCNSTNGQRILYRNGIGSNQTALSFMAWFTTTADVASAQDVVGAFDTTVSAIPLWGCIISAGSFFIRATNLVSNDYASYAAVANTEYYMAVVFDGSLAGNSNRLKVYIAGAPVAPAYVGTIPARTGAARVSTGVLGYANSSRCVSGFQLRHTRIWNRALSAADVAALYAGRDIVL